MSNDFKHIDKLYKEAFSDYKAPTDNISWDAINKKATSMRFYKFSFKTFNIYYASIITTIVSSIIVGSVMFYSKDNNKSNDVGNTQNTIVTKVDSSVSVKEYKLTDTLDNKLDMVSDKTFNNMNLSESIDTPVKKEIKPASDKPENKITIDTVTVDTTKYDVTYKDTVSNIDTSIQNLDDKVNVEVKHKTVILRDTVYYKNKKKKRRKKKN